MSKPILTSNHHASPIPLKYHNAIPLKIKNVSEACGRARSNTLLRQSLPLICKRPRIINSNKLKKAQKTWIDKQSLNIKYPK